MYASDHSHRLRSGILAVALALAVLPAIPADAAVTCRGKPVTITGTNGSDIIKGTDGADVIAGRGGNDTIRGRGGDDIICGGNGNDRIFGGTGDDTLIGEGGADEIWGNAGDDIIRGSSGDDILHGDLGADFVLGGNGADHLWGGNGSDVVSGNTGADTVRGGGGADSVYGGHDDDTLFGEGGNDTLYGGAGDDELSGGNGRDILRGGSGEDELRGDLRISQFDGGPGDDVIWDFAHSDTHLAEGSPGATGDVFAYSRIEITPRNGWLLWVPAVGKLAQGHEGVLKVTNRPDGLLMVERIDPERYLLGIAEMPYSWEAAALQSQAIAARTYLANLVSNPRYGVMAEYGFDICDWSLCQEYRGTKYGWLEPWEDAVAATAGRVLLHNGAPASTFYHSTSGDTTRSIEDVWPQAQPVSYLQAVPVPEQNSPFGNWWYQLPLEAFVDILARDGITFSSPVEHIKTLTSEPGDGPYRVRIRTLERNATFPITVIHEALNRHALQEYGEYLPPLHHNPGINAAVLSPTFTVKLRSNGMVMIRGQGWGHQIGLSQYGANALAKSGSTVEEILGHFYTGLVPEDDPGLIPDLVDVGLFYDNGDESIVLNPTGKFTVRSGGRAIRTQTGGTITLTRHGDDGVTIQIEH